MNINENLYKCISILGELPESEIKNKLIEILQNEIRLRIMDFDISRRLK